MNYYITGDTHANFDRLHEFCQRMETSAETDTLIIAGDSGINYYLDDFKHYEIMKTLKNLPITILCVHGNHEDRASNIPRWYMKVYKAEIEGYVYLQKMYENVQFLICGEVYKFNGAKTLIVGGAYSVDKSMRLAYGYSWFPNEQPDEKIKALTRKNIVRNNGKLDNIITHTCPINDRPIENFNLNIDQSTVDTSTEEFLQEVKETTQFNNWYCGHYHIDKTRGDMQFLFNSILKL